MTVPVAFFSRVDHWSYQYAGCECQRCNPTPKALVNHVLPSEDGREAASWVVSRRDPPQIMFETYNAALIVALNHTNYQAVPIYNHLAQINRDLRRERCERIKSHTMTEP